jgi:hypothetical protein
VTGIPPGAITAHDAYWRVKETGPPPPFSDLSVKLQQCWTAAAAAAARAERDRILVPDDTLHADGSIGPNDVPPGLSPDPAYWYRRWLFAMNQLDKEANERISAYAGMREHLDKAARTAAANVEEDRIRAAERDRIRHLAAEYRAVYFTGNAKDGIEPSPFASLLTEGDTP